MEVLIQTTKLLSEKEHGLTERDKGEMLCYSPPLRNEALAWSLKEYWFEGKKSKEAAIICGVSPSLAKKYFACFSRALRHPNAAPLSVESGLKRQKTSTKKEKESDKKTGAKNRKSLNVNFSTPTPPCHTFRGVTYRRERGCFQAQKRVGRKVKFLGNHKTAQAAATAVKDFEQWNFGK